MIIVAMLMMMMMMMLEKNTEEAEDQAAKDLETKTKEALSYWNSLRSICLEAWSPVASFLAYAQ